MGYYAKYCESVAVPAMAMTVVLCVITFRFAQRLGAGEALKRAPSLGDGRARKHEPYCLPLPHTFIKICK